ncbi:hypothetical protein SK128_025850, partial [Halocaridina rubra]
QQLRPTTTNNINHSNYNDDYDHKNYNIKNILKHNLNIANNAKLAIAKTTATTTASQAITITRT